MLHPQSGRAELEHLCDTARASIRLQAGRRWEDLSRQDQQAIFDVVAKPDKLYCTDIAQFAGGYIENAVPDLREQGVQEEAARYDIHDWHCPELDQLWR
jgi:hypothetical protein